MAAIRDSAPLDTSMGFSPLGGLVMSTRPGDVDPGLLIYLQEQEGLGPLQLDQLLNTQIGLLGLSGFTADMRELLAGSSPAAQLAIDIYCYQIRKYIGAYLAVLGGADAVIFSGGIGLHAASIRRRILKDMSWCGVNLHEAANEMAIDREHCISTEDSQVAVWVMNVDEAAAMVRSGAHLFR